jgi:hypothetical protein
VTVWPTPEDDPADVSIEQLEGDVARLEAENEVLREMRGISGVDENAEIEGGEDVPTGQAPRG